MINLKGRKLIPLCDYLCHGDVCCECCAEILELIEPSDAIVKVDDMDFVDIEAYDNYILSILDDLKKEAEEENTYTKADDYLCVVEKYIDDRRRYINGTAIRYNDRCPNKRLSYKQGFEFAITNCSVLFGHFIHAHKLLFSSTPTAADLSGQEDSKKDNPDSE